MKKTAVIDEMLVMRLTVVEQELALAKHTIEAGQRAAADAEQRLNAIRPEITKAILALGLAPTACGIVNKPGINIAIGTLYDPTNGKPFEIDVPDAPALSIVPPVADDIPAAVADEKPA